MLGSTDWLPGGGVVRGWFRSPTWPLALDASQAARIAGLLEMKAEAGSKAPLTEAFRNCQTVTGQ